MVNVWVGIRKGEKTSIQLFTENMTKELYVSINGETFERNGNNGREKLWVDMR